MQTRLEGNRGHEQHERDSLPQSWRAPVAQLIRQRTGSFSTHMCQNPTAEESGFPGVDASIWTGLFAPAGTPAAIVNRINTEVAATLKQPEVRERFATLGSEPVSMSPALFQKRVKQDAERYRKIVQLIGLEVQ
jgi:tripartite-type tricarboxylate transporter receptor subunit TctC